MVVSKSVPKPKSHKPALKKKQALKFSICCSPGVIDEDIISPGILEKYLKEHIKVNKKLNNLGKDIHIERDKSTINITANIPFSKRLVALPLTSIVRYLKYLTKKFLKRHKLRDFSESLQSLKILTNYDSSTLRMRTRMMKKRADHFP
ncbi:60S ribosomal protein L22 2 isoform 2 [Schistosoma japonicum]|uniref:Large ribosomal subunit protein eL22 n=1 Tax=Schistosoma japonicum TaxID=6182 RepID=A0A4Z2CSV3_SCHJA|nr:60S ribosomal protein L22 2 isoform 2 [Schistosoma japonicum]